MSPGDPDRTRPPAPGPVRSHRFPEIHQRTVGALRILISPRHELPLIGLRLVSSAGADHDPEEMPGLAGFVGAMLEEGTARRGSTELAQAVEDVGAQLASRAEWNSTGISFGALARHLDLGVELLAEIALQPAFAPREVERIRGLRLGELRRRASEPAYLAARALARALFGRHTYGAPLLGTEAGLRAVGPGECRSWWERHRGARPALIAVGDLDPAAVIEAVTARFGGLHGGGSPAPLDTVEANPPRTEVHLVDRPQAAQTELRLGQLGLPRDDPQRPALVLLNSVLGGKFTSRINLNLRERHGFTYGASSRQIDRLGRGPWVIQAAVDTEVAGRATEEVIAELQRIRAEPVPAAELEESRSYLLGVIPYTLQTLRGLAARLDEIALFGLPLDYFERFPERLRAVTAEDLLEAARRLIAPERLVITAAGPAARLEPQLAAFGPVSVHRPSAQPPPAGSDAA
ncbi:MAG TPA: pitrilysin family protein [Thermoanaerobaculia bacterium]|nr:pitrilysin family protein [Thermoanaerobaculia bacterium]